MPRISGSLESGKANPKFCVICNHPNRAEIEMAILNISPSNPRLNLDSIADAFGVTPTDLRVHALMHTPLALDFTEESECSLVENFRERCADAQLSQLPNGEGATSRSHEHSVSINPTMRDRMTDMVNMREGDMLLTAANEYLTTITALGRRIKRYAGDATEGSDQRLAAFCTNALVSMYIGAGGELRNAIKGINELNTAVNGPKDSSADGLKALAGALSASFTLAGANTLGGSPDEDVESAATHFGEAEDTTEFDS